MSYRCPWCGHTNRLTVVVKVWADLVQYEGNFETDIRSGDHDWDHRSMMACRVCDYWNESSHFEINEEVTQ